MRVRIGRDIQHGPPGRRLGAEHANKGAAAVHSDRLLPGGTITSERPDRVTSGVAMVTSTPRRGTSTKYSSTWLSHQHRARHGFGIGHDEVLAPRIPGPAGA
jgi:hypothetical protein